jgi:hypothetical protein
MLLVTRYYNYIEQLRIPQRPIEYRPITSRLCQSLIPIDEQRTAWHNIYLWEFHYSHPGFAVGLKKIETPPTEGEIDYLTPKCLNLRVGYNGQPAWGPLCEEYSDTTDEDFLAQG